MPLLVAQGVSLVSCFLSLLLCLGIEFESVELTLEVFTATTLQMEKSTLDPLGSIKSWVI